MKIRKFHITVHLNKGPRLKPGMVLAIEPMVNAGKRYVKTLADNWTVLQQMVKCVLILSIRLLSPKQDMKSLTKI